MEGGRLFPVTEEQNALAQIRALHAAECSQRGIVRELERLGYRPRVGLNVWHPKMIRSLIVQVAV